jgi:hypothetical protein
LHSESIAFEQATRKDTTMKSYLPAAVLGTALTVGAIGFGAATAHAAVDYSSQSASSAASELQKLGYSVEFNGTVDGSLAACKVTSVNGLSATPSGTAYVTVDCPDSNN